MHGNYIKDISQGQCKVKRYDDVFKIDEIRIMNMIKTRVLQAMIHIERPSGWDKERIRKLAIEIKMIKIYRQSSVKNTIY